MLIIIVEITIENLRVEGILEQRFSHFNVHVSHLGILVKCRSCRSNKISGDTSVAGL